MSANELFPAAVGCVVSAILAMYFTSLAEQRNMQRQAVAYECADFVPPDGEFKWRRNVSDGAAPLPPPVLDDE